MTLEAAHQRARLQSESGDRWYVIWYHDIDGPPPDLSYLDVPAQIAERLRYFRIYKPRHVIACYEGGQEIPIPPCPLREVRVPKLSRRTSGN